MNRVFAAAAIGLLLTSCTSDLSRSAAESQIVSKIREEPDTPFMLGILKWQDTWACLQSISSSVGSVTNARLMAALRSQENFELWVPVRVEFDRLSSVATPSDDQRRVDFTYKVIIIKDALNLAADKKQYLLPGDLELTDECVKKSPALALLRTSKGTDPMIVNATALFHKSADGWRLVQFESSFLAPVGSRPAFQLLPIDPK